MAVFSHGSKQSPMARYVPVMLCMAKDPKAAKADKELNFVEQRQRATTGLVTKNVTLPERMPSGPIVVKVAHR